MTKKSFKNEFNPALQFISSPESEENQEPQNTPAKRSPQYAETKSKRLQLLMQPTLHDKLKEMAEQKGTSVNDLIHTILEQASKKNK